MQKKNMWILIIVIVIVVAVGGYAIFHKSSKNPSSTTNSTSTSNSSSSSNKKSSSNEIIQTETESGLGQFLADFSGKTLYNYSKDTTGLSNCTGSCLASWPAYSPTSTSASLPANVTIITRPDGSKQYAYKGMPLYTFASESSGQVTGNGVSGFNVVKP